MKKYIYTGLSISICLLLAWSTGFNFDKRGGDLFLVLYLTIAVGGLTYLSTWRLK